jgi:hypothetical protein
MALVLFCAQQGFAGAFSERVLDVVGQELSDSELLVVGARGHAIIAAREIAIACKAAMPSIHSLPPSSPIESPKRSLPALRREKSTGLRLYSANGGRAKASISSAAACSLSISRDSSAQQVGSRHY